MSLRTFALTYLLGGLTFLPLLVAAVLTLLWFTLPHADDPEQLGRETSPSSKDQENERLANKEGEDSNRAQSQAHDFAASGTFAVLRSYDFEAAIGAINARNNGTGTTGSNDTLDKTQAADTATGIHSPSVYQTMYRSVFDRSKSGAITNPLFEEEDAEPDPRNKNTRRKPAAANVMYIVLRHGHLMLYDSSAQVEVKHVISLTHHRVSLQATPDIQASDESKIPEADLFVKRTAIVLTPIELPNGALQTQQQQRVISRPFYLFSSTNIKKEDFYHALIATRPHPPTPEPIAPEGLIKLQSTLQSSSLTPETRAINALIGRVFLALYHTDRLKDFVRNKIEKKLNRIQKPSFIPSLKIESIDLGDAGPVLSSPRLRDLNVSGDLVLSAEMKYTGGLSLTIFAIAKLDLGPRFKARTVDLVLKVSLQRIMGPMLFRVKPPPSNRIWFCFEHMPEMEIRVEPVVSERKITYGFVLRTIEERIKHAISDGLVRPNWDDVPMPLSDTKDKYARGGLWSDDGREASEQPQASSPWKAHLNKDEKTMSMPALNAEPVGDADTVAPTAVNSELDLTQLRPTQSAAIEDRHLRRRPVASQEKVQTSSSESNHPQHPPKPLRTPSSSAPSIAIDGQNVSPTRADDASARSTSSSVLNKSMWRYRGSGMQQFQPKAAMEELRAMRDRAGHRSGKTSTVASETPATGEENMDDDSVLDPAGESISSPSHQRKVSASTTSGSFTMERTDSDQSTVSSSTSSRSLQMQQKKQTIMAATAAATNAARTWGWNTIQKNKSSLGKGLPKREQQEGFVQSEPIGRGQPLPPPGVPLPGPQKPTWPSIGNIRKKSVPALPPRRPRPSDADNIENQRTEHDSSNSDKEQQVSGGTSSHSVEDDFGPWRENSGPSSMMEDQTQTEPNDTEHGVEVETTEHDLNAHSEPSIGDLIELEHDQTQPPHSSNSLNHDVVQESASKATPLKKVPPPLPARRRQPSEDVSDPLHAPQAEHEIAQVNDHDVRSINTNHESEAPGLRVPDAAVDAVAAETATPVLAQGDTDDGTRIDEQEAIHSSTATEPMTLQDSVIQGQDYESEKHGQKEQDTHEHFALGEDVDEEDFEHEGLEGQEAQQSSEEHSAEPSLVQTAVSSAKDSHGTSPKSSPAISSENLPAPLGERDSMAKMEADTHTLVENPST